MDKLLNALLVKERDLGLNQREFAQRLGISESYWSLLRGRQRPITDSICTRARLTFSDLTPLALEIQQQLVLKS